MKRFLIILGLVLLGWVAGPPAAWGTVFEWTDESGAVLYTDDLGQVPEHLRSKAKPVELTPAASPPSPPAASSPPTLPSEMKPAPLRPKAVKVRYYDSGGGKFVKVRVAGQVDTFMLLDTGATFCDISRGLADTIGIRYDARTPIMVLQTANGLKIEPFVKIPSLRIGSLEVRDVAATVDVSIFEESARRQKTSFNPDRRNGILGLSFLDHFIVTVDAEAGTLTLTPRPKKDSAQSRGGHSRRWWRKRFTFFHRMVSDYGRALAGLKAASTTDAYAELKVRMDLSIRYFEDELRNLEHQAAAHGVPLEWRR